MMKNITRIIPPATGILFPVSETKDLDMTKRIITARNAIGISLHTAFLSILMGNIIEVIPRTSRMFAILLPITFPRAMSPFPLNDAKMLTISSGVVVPIETIVSPIIIVGTPSLCAREDAPPTRKSAPLIRRTIPKTNSRISRIIF